MKKIIASFLIIILYIGLTGVISSQFNPEGLLSYLMTDVFLLVVSLCILLFVFLTHSAEKYGLSSWPTDPRRFLYFIPLLVFVSTQLWGGASPALGGAKLLCALISMLFVGFIEEMLFRGFLVTALKKAMSPVAAIIVSAVVFGSVHFVNLAGGQSLFETLLQVVYAAVIGLMYAALFNAGGSLWPCIISHALYDALSYFNNAGVILSWIVIAATVTVCLAYGLFLMRKTSFQPAGQKLPESPQSL